MMKHHLTAALVCAAALYCVDAVWCDGWYVNAVDKALAALWARGW
jgi:hypothetical protein